MDRGRFLQQTRGGLGGLSVLMTDPNLRDELLRLFLDSQDVTSLRDWQQTYVKRPFTEQTGVVLQLPPGAGKTLIAQWVILESLAFFPSRRVIFAVPLRVLAVQVRNDIERVLNLFNQFAVDHGLGLELPGKPGGGIKGFTVALAEGPGASIDVEKDNVIVATYEHAAGELRKDPRDVADRNLVVHVGLVIIDEVHNIAKQDRGMVIDDVLFFTNLRNMLSPSIFNDGERTYVMPQIIGMSGTLEDWVSKRLKEAYSNLVREILTPDQLQLEVPQQQLMRGTLRIQQETQLQVQDQQSKKRGPPRVILPKNKFTTSVTADLALTITKSLLKRRLEHPEERPKRLVVFMSCVAEAEMAFIHVYSDPAVRNYIKLLSESTRTKTIEGRQVQVEAYMHPRIQFVNRLSTLKEKYGEGFGFELELSNIGKGGTKKLDDRTIVTDIAEKLESGGVYIHHAQITAPKVPSKPGQPPPPTWSDVVQEQLSTDFVAVFSTSTISVGVNLASTQVGILGPNTMWTVDQAEQMIGRVGRVNEDANESFVAIVDSRLYHAPIPVSISVPDAWFIPRFAAAISFSRAWAYRNSIPELNEQEEINNIFLRQLIEARKENEAQPIAIKTDITKDIRKPLIEPFANLDVRGFFKPASAAALHISDIPGNGITELARSWNIIDDNADITPQARLALEFCKQDLKSLPATLYILNALFSSENDVNPESWRIFFLWALMQVRLPPKWIQWFPVNTKSEKAQEAPGVEFSRYVHSFLGLPKLFPRTGEKSVYKRFRNINSNARELSDIVDNMIRLFGEAHEAYPGQPDVPGENNAESVRSFADMVAWAFSVFPNKWPTEKALDLYTYMTEDVWKFISKLREDLNKISFHLIRQQLNNNAIFQALEKTNNFIIASVFPFSAHRPDLDELTRSGLSLGTYGAVGYLVPFSIKANQKLNELNPHHRLQFLDILMDSLIVMGYRDADALNKHNTEIEMSKGAVVVRAHQRKNDSDSEDY